MTVSDYNDAKMFYINRTVLNASESKTKESLFEDTGANQEQVIYEHQKRLSLHASQVAHQAGAYPGFCSMKRLGVFLLPPGWDASPSQGYPQH